MEDNKKILEDLGGDFMEFHSQGLYAECREVVNHLRDLEYFEAADTLEIVLANTPVRSLNIESPYEKET